MAKKAMQETSRAEQAGRAVRRVPRFLLLIVAGLALWNLWLTWQLSVASKMADYAQDDARRALNRANAAYEMAER
jgi:hypothetical protein